MALELDPIRGVKTWYGEQDRNQSEYAKQSVDGMIHEDCVTVTGSDYASLSFTLPAGALLIDSWVEVVEAFALGGTTPTIAVGTDGSAPTNSIVDVAEADAEAVGTYAGVPAGTFTSPLAADTACAIELGGTTPTITDAGKMYVHFRYKLDKR